MNVIYQRCLFTYVFNKKYYTQESVSVFFTTHSRDGGTNLYNVLVLLILQHLPPNMYGVPIKNKLINYKHHLLCSYS